MYVEGLWQFQFPVAHKGLLSSDLKATILLFWNNLYRLCLDQSNITLVFYMQWSQSSIFRCRRSLFLVLLQIDCLDNISFLLLYY